jgi:hypothetical protein
MVAMISQLSSSVLDICQNPLGPYGVALGEVADGKKIRRWDRRTSSFTQNFHLSVF